MGREEREVKKGTGSWGRDGKKSNRNRSERDTRRERERRTGEGESDVVIRYRHTECQER